MTQETRIQEKDLILPALTVIERQPGISTSALIEELEQILHPTGEDAAILANRKDTKFSQKVRNLKSHRESNGMDIWTHYKSGSYSLTEAGKAYLEEHREAAQYLAENPFSYEDAQKLIQAVQNGRKKILLLPEDALISEGASRKMTVTQRKRSGALRKAALEHYKNADGHICCAVCGFDFWKTYGEMGKDFIEFHHENPVFQMGSQGEAQFVQEAVKKVKPVCPNCHRMLHRKRKHVLTIEELKERIEEQYI